ncbi:Tetratricopeptide repeat-like superfamily protein [Hibiscus syriacus]|uniref:Tetratricopeptide repeat-like superfamily protein n=1 Tax=Hibiscus syriacus TaxID=106335 RepID=A0A6A2Y9A2_HIBSY|nr:Tetratricopeptide repeat-like superfamily protein [Hibiscus syriacus]
MPFITLVAHCQLRLRQQAVAKLKAQMSEMMRESSHLWAPPIYRRLLSIDKRERDMSERCLLKIKSTILPAPISLSKAIIEDVRKNLLTGMKDWLDKGMKVQTVLAWGWFISFLGSGALKNRHLVNDMLKVLEQTFSDHNPQVQIASLVAWQGLIDALVHPQILYCKRNASQQLQTSSGKSSELMLNGFSKSLKLTMTPLTGIISNCISAKCSDLISDPKDQINLRLSARTIIPGSGRYSWKQFLFSQLDFYFKMIAIIITHVATATISPESRKTACDAAVRIFRSVLKGVQMEFRNPLNNYDNIMFCLNIIFSFTKKVGEDASSEGVGDLFNTSLSLIEAAVDELEPSIMESPLYKVALDINYVGTLDSVNCSKVLHQCSFMDMVSPMV